MEYDEEYKKENWIKPQEKSQSQKYKILAIFHIFFIDFSLGAHPSCGSEREAVSVEGRERHFYSVLWTFGNGTALSRSLASIFQQSLSGLSFLYFVYFSILCTPFVSLHFNLAAFQIATHRLREREQLLNSLFLTS